MHRAKRYLLTILLTTLGAQAQIVTLVGPAANCRAWVPTGNTLGETWKNIANPSNIGSWFTGTMGVGYELDANNNYDPLINLDVESQMFNNNQTCYIRISFTIPDQATLTAYQSPPNAGNSRLQFKIKYDDGFIAYVNGTQAAERNPPTTTPTWNSAARTTHDDNDALIYTEIDISPSASSLVVGQNVLALHALNAGLTSSDAIWVVELTGDSSPPPIPPAWPNITWQELSDELGTANDIACPNDGSGRLFIANLFGTIQIYENGDVRNTEFMDIDDGRLGTFYDGEGLLSLAFPPSYSNSGAFYVTYTSEDVANSSNVTEIVLSRFFVEPGDPNLADPDSEVELLRIPYPTEFHNSAQIRFGPDGMLYMGVGDGGEFADPNGYAQNRMSFLGKMLRIDVEGPPSPGLPYRIPPDNPFVSNTSTANEIWIIGLRNPRSWSFDSETDALWLADATDELEFGQNEVNLVGFTFADGNDFGWRYYDGASASGYGGNNPVPRITPRHEYPGTFARCSVIGGEVYRGDEFPLMQGFYFFADYCTGISALGIDNTGGYLRNDYPVNGASQVTKFVTGEDGTFYFITNLGKLFTISDSQGEDFQKITNWKTNGAGGHEVTFGTRLNSPSGLQYSYDLNTWELVTPLQTASDLYMTVINPFAAHTAEPRLYYRAVIESGQ